MSRSRIFPLLASIFVLSIISLPFLSVTPRPGPPPLPLLSPQTSYFTTPLTPDGRVDYVEAINLRDSAGVTPDTNALVLIFKTFGPTAIQNDHREEYFRRLGIPSLPESGDYLPSNYTSSEQLIKALYESTSRQSPKPARGFVTFQSDVYRQLRKPWSEKQLPTFAAWFDQHNHFMDQFVAAANRPRFYSPHVGDGKYFRILPLRWDNAVFGILRDIPRYLVTRANLRLGRNQNAAALDDIMAIRKLARLVASESHNLSPAPYLLDGVAVSAESTILSSGLLAESELQRALAERLTLSEFHYLLHFVDRCERIVLLDYTTDLLWADFTDKGLEKLDLYFESLFKPRRLSDWQLKSLQVAFHHPETLNAALRLINREMDCRVAALSAPSWNDRLEQMRNINLRLYHETDEILTKGSFGSTRFIANMLALDPVTRGEQIGTIVLDSVGIRYGYDLTDESRANARHHLSQVAFAIALYQSRYKSLPASLDDLVTNGILDHIPVDPFNNKPLLFHPQGDQWSLSSVGPNGIDDFHKLNPKQPHEIDDIIFRYPAP